MEAAGNYTGEQDLARQIVRVADSDSAEASEAMAEALAS